MTDKFDDDNRVVADMSNLDQRGLMGSWLGIFDPNVRAQYKPEKKRNSEELSREDKRALIFYAMKYSFAIGMVFLTAFGLFVLLLTLLWKS